MAAVKPEGREIANVAKKHGVTILEDVADRSWPRLQHSCRVSRLSLQP